MKIREHLQKKFIPGYYDLLNQIIQRASIFFEKIIFQNILMNLNNI
jgi:hypothetical protein